MSHFNSSRAAASGEASPKVVKKAFRGDIQGLRAIAVLAVIADHMFGYPLGGFVGVDVFFVLSGFLITGLMLREFDKTGKISFGDFYRRRVRRIMPVALFVLIVTTAASWYLFLGERTRSITLDAASAAIFGANWRFAAQGTDYLQADGPVSPLQHYWSLSVEEQFYLVWPALFVLVLGVLAARFAWDATRAKHVLTLVVVAVTLGSLAFAAWETQANPTVAYFSTFSRAWELGVGALIAVLAPRLSRIPAAVRPALQWLGLAGIIASLFLITPETAFPAPGALLPVLATALVVAGGIGGPRYVFPLTNVASRYIGDISYSLYLWHFPVIIFAGAVYPERGAFVILGMLVATSLLSVFSYHLIEDPIRKSSWLDPSAKKKQKMSAESAVRLQLTAVSALAVITAVVSVMAINHGPTSAAQAVPAPIPQASSGTAAAVSPADVLSASLLDATKAAEWPELSPSMDALGSAGFPVEDAAGCAPATDSGKDCSISTPDPSKLAIVAGDSMAIAWLPAIRAALEPNGWTVHAVTYAGCPFLDADVASETDDRTEACAGHREIVRTVIAESKPGLLILSNAYNQGMIAEDRKPSLTAWEAAATRAQSEWTEAAGRVVVIQSPPQGADPKECVTRISKPTDCVAPIVKKTWSDYAAVDRRVAERAGHAYIETKKWFCTSGSMCPVFADGITIRRDKSHITEEYARKLAPLLGVELAGVTG